MIKQFKSKQFLLFLITGGVAAVVNFGSRIIYSTWLNFSTAIVLAYITGMITAFVLARIFVFHDSQRALPHSALYFAMVNAAAVLQTWIISVLLAFYVLPYFGVRHFTDEIAHAVGIMAPVFTSYLGHKYFTFRS